MCLATSRVQFFATPWTVALQSPLSMGILQARILEWFAMPFSRKAMILQLKKKKFLVPMFGPQYTTNQKFF